MNARNFDKAIAGQAAWRGGFAILGSWLAIVAYLWFRFGNWRWGLAAVVCLVHDVVIVVGLVAASKWLAASPIGAALGIQSFKIDLAMVAAILTVIGYSVNDTIVVFDRIRENRGKLATVSPLVINTSINQTLARTLLTSGTTLIVVLTMYLIGGAGIHPFSYALLMGILFGTYSSIAVASPLLMGFRRALVARTAGAVPDQQS
jgi:SecD/SecF fusion protein